MPADWETVDLPHSWNAVDGQDGGNDYFRGTCYYAKTLNKAELPVAKAYYLEIQGANSSADVYVDGKHLCHHDGGYSTWRVNLTDALTEEENLLSIVVDNAALLALNEYTAQSALPQDAPVLSPEFEESRKALIREKVAAFNQLAEPYIKGREEAARATLTEHQARAEEEARRITEQAAAQEAARQESINSFVQILTDNKRFAGEWTRDNRFGEISLNIEQAKKFDNAIQFIGTIYDTKLPEASLDIAGRCELNPAEDGTTQVDISIYDGQYDPDQPTAEVYDAKDGMLSLRLSKDGKLSGIMSCTSWANSPEKAFKINMTPRAKQETRGKRRR
jgi:hypothetical protein